MEAYSERSSTTLWDVQCWVRSTADLQDIAQAPAEQSRAVSWTV